MGAICKHSNRGNIKTTFFISPRRGYGQGVTTFQSISDHVSNLSAIISQ